MRSYIHQRYTAQVWGIVYLCSRLTRASGTNKRTTPHFLFYKNYQPPNEELRRVHITITTMEYINVNLPDGTLLSLECNKKKKKRICTLSQDVEINGWTIRKEIKIGGPLKLYNSCANLKIEIA